MTNIFLDLEDVKSTSRLILLYDVETTRGFSIPNIHDNDLYDNKVVELFGNYKITQISWILFNSQSCNISSSGNYDVEETWQKEMIDTLQRDENEYYMKWKLRNKTSDYKVTTAPLSVCLEAFITDLKKASVLSSYNLNFDIPVTVAELIRLNKLSYVELIKNTNKLCMMRASTEASNDVSNRSIVRTGLRNIYIRLFYKEIPNHHDSYYDCLNTLDVYKRLPHIDPAISKSVDSEIIKLDALKVDCVCGSQIKWNYRSKHFKTQKHCNYVSRNNINQSDIDLDFEQCKEYYLIFQIHEKIYAPQYIDKDEMGINNNRANKGLCLMVSEIAALAGYNYFVNESEAIKNHITQYEVNFCRIAKDEAVKDSEIHKPNCKLFYKFITNEEKKEYTYRDEYNRLCKTYPEIYEKIKQLPSKIVDTVKIAASTKSITEYREIVESAIVQEINENPELNPEEIVNFTIPENDRTHISIPAITGRVREIGTIELLRKEGYIIDDLQHSVSGIVNIKNHQIKIFGRVDGILYDHITNLPVAVVDVKNRMKWKSIEEYDHIQLCCYAVLKGLKAILIEDYRERIELKRIQSRNILYQDENRTLLIRVYSVEECKHYWNKVLSSYKLAINIDKINSLISDPYSVEAMIFARKSLMSIPSNSLSVIRNISGTEQQLNDKSKLVGFNSQISGKMFNFH